MAILYVNPENCGGKQAVLASELNWWVQILNFNNLTLRLNLDLLNIIIMVCTWWTRHNAYKHWTEGVLVVLFILVKISINFVFHYKISAKHSNSLKRIGEHKLVGPSIYICIFIKSALVPVQHGILKQF